MTDQTDTTKLSQSSGKKEKLILWAMFLITIGLYLPQTPMMKLLILRDTALRYAPMAEAFASGDWQYAFHPRLQFLHPLVSGCFTWLLNSSGAVGAQLSALLFLGLCIFPLYYLLKLVFDRQTALGGCVIFPLQSYVLLVCLPGLRESHKMLAILLICLGILSIYSDRERYSGYLLTGLGGGLAFCTRNDILLPALFMLTAAGALEFAALKSLKRSFTALAVVLPLAAIEIIINWKLCGYPVPGNRFLPFLLKLPQIFRTPGAFLFCIAPAAFALYCAISAGSGFLLRKKWGKIVLAGLLFLCLAALCFKICSIYSAEGNAAFKAYLKKIFFGCNPPLLCFSVVGIIIKLLQRKWSARQSILLALFLFWGFLPAIQILVAEHRFYVSERYMLPATLLLSGWGVATVLGYARVLKKILPKWLALTIFWISCISVAPLAVFHAYTHIHYAWKSPNRARRFIAIARMSEIIRQNYKGPSECTPGFNIDHYRSNRRPKVAFLPDCRESTTAYLSGGSTCENPNDADFLVIGDGSQPESSVWQKISGDIRSRKETFQIWKRRELK